MKTMMKSAGLAHMMMSAMMRAPAGEQGSGMAMADPMCGATHEPADMLRGAVKNDEIDVHDDGMADVSVLASDRADTDAVARLGT
jgi:hypothetical protein